MGTRKERRRRQQRQGTVGAIEALRRTELFRDLDEAALVGLAGEMQQHSFERRQLLLEDGAGCEGLMVFASGTARLYRLSPDGREVTLVIFAAGDVLGLSPVASALVRQSRLEATSARLLTYYLPQDSYRRSLALHPAVGPRALEVMGQRLTMFCDRVEELALYPVPVRLAHELAQRAQQGGTAGGGPSHRELATWIGASQTQVSRLLVHLRDQQLIASTPRRRGITVLEPEKLAVYGMERLQPH